VVAEEKVEMEEPENKLLYSAHWRANLFFLHRRRLRKTFLNDRAKKPQPFLEQPRKIQDILQKELSVS
jgi:hypothetical protein